MISLCFFFAKTQLIVCKVTKSKTLHQIFSKQYKKTLKSEKLFVFSAKQYTILAIHDLITKVTRVSHQGGKP